MKINIGQTNCMFPLPTILLGANVSGKPTYMTVAWDGVVDFNFISVAVLRSRFTYIGIKENKTFSINVPSVDMLAQTDYCGLVSGRRADKGALFDNFYGKLKTAPMIQECPLTMECRLAHVVDLFPSHDVLIWEIVASYAEEACLGDGEVDWAKVRPILFTGTDSGYWDLGKRLGQIGSLGKQLKVKATS